MVWVVSPHVSRWLQVGSAFVVVFLTGCWVPAENEVVVYAALDREFSEPILKQFEQQTGIAVRAKYDVESTKTVGLVTRIIEERERPGCDVFWNNEILHTLRLDQLGLLSAYQSSRAEQFPASYRSAQGLWYGMAARARVLLVNREQVAEGERPQSLADLTDPRWRDRVGIAKPLFGTTATHAAVLFATWGDARAQEFFRRMKGNVRILSGNKQVAIAVGHGQLAFGLTDTDDAIIEVEQGRPVDIVFPDQQPGALGTLLIPNTVALVRGGPHARQAERLLEFLLTPAVEEQLAQGRSSQIPLQKSVSATARVLANRSVKWMEVDFAAAATAWEHAAGFLRDEFAAAD
jgi:iron(III) transport system substrate-binding protein